MGDRRSWLAGIFSGFLGLLIPWKASTAAGKFETIEVVADVTFDPDACELIIEYTVIKIDDRGRLIHSGLLTPDQARNKIREVLPK